jgi:hypothetical protein
MKYQKILNVLEDCDDYAKKWTILAIIDKIQPKFALNRKSHILRPEIEFAEETRPGAIPELTWNHKSNQDHETETSKYNRDENGLSSVHLIRSTPHHPALIQII